MEACFKAGMSAIFKEDHGTVMPWLNKLEHAAESGHELAMYVLSCAPQVQQRCHQRCHYPTVVAEGRM